MAAKFIVFAVCVAAANAGYLSAPAAVGYAAYGAAPAYNAYSAGYAAPSVASISQNTYRSQGNLGQVSTYSKALDTPYSSIRKTDTRVSNDALAYGAAPVASYGAYASPALTSYAAAPAISSYGAYASPAISTYGAYASPAVASYGAYAAPAAYAARSAYAPAIAKYASPSLGVAYSAAPLVAHMSFNGLGVNYAY